MSERALVTGGTGFTGGRLARTLVARGFQVRALVRDKGAAGDLAAQGIECVEGDLRDAEAVHHAVRGCDRVFHVAAAYRSAKLKDQDYRDINVGGTVNVLDACRAAGAPHASDGPHLVHVSTIGVHGGVREVPANEDAPFAPGDIYQVTKLEAERRVRHAFTKGQRGVVVRPAGIYGPGDLRFLKLFRTIASKRFRMFGSGKVFTHLVHVDDLVEGMLQASTEPVANGGVYILAGARYVELNELVQRVAEAVGVKPPSGRLPYWPLYAAAALCEGVCRPLRIEPPLHRRRAQFFVKNRAFSIAKARNDLRYMPKVDLASGLRQTAEWYTQEGLL